MFNFTHFTKSYCGICF